MKQLYSNKELLKEKKDYPFPIKLPQCLFQKSINPVCMGLYLVFLLCSIDVYIYSYSKHILDKCSCIIISDLMGEKKKTRKTSAGEGVEKGEPSCTAGGNVNWCSHYREQYGGSSKNLK